jgi:hypothetical protein
LAEISAALAEDERNAPGEEAHPEEDSSAQRWDQRVAAAVQSLGLELALIADVALAWFSQDQNLQTGGHDPRKTGFQLQQLELSFGGAVDPYFRFDANLVFSLYGVEIEEAYATTLALPGRLQARAGQFLSRFGRLNATHPHQWDFVDQPFALGRVFGGEGGRGLGVELSWLTPLPWYVEVVGAVTEAAGASTARSFFGADDLGIESPLDFLYTVAIKQFFALSEHWSLAWGLSGAFGPNSTGQANRTDLYGIDLYLKWRPIGRTSHHVVALQAEWIYRRRQLPGDVAQDLSGYVYGTWRFAQRWGTALRYEQGTPAYDLNGNQRNDPLDPYWTDHRHRVSANVTFWPTEFSRLRLQVSVDLPGWQPEPSWAAVLAAEFVAGAHGSHSF